VAQSGIIFRMNIDGESKVALLDTGCSQTIVKGVEKWGRKRTVVGVNGSSVECRERRNVPMSINGKTIYLNCLVMKKLPEGVEAIVGLDLIRVLGGIKLDSNVNFEFLKKGCAMVACNKNESAQEVIESVNISDTDFNAEFNGKFWNVEWKYSKEIDLKNKVACYRVVEEDKEKWETELREWVKNGWLIKRSKVDKGIIPLMSVKQHNKGKVRPVLDFRELNEYVVSHTIESPACNDKVRKWRTFGKDIALLDLKKAYLQLHVDKKLWKFQIVKFHGEYYNLTRLGFGFKSAPTIMSKVLDKVIKMDDQIFQAVDHYIDDIIIKTDKVTTSKVMSHLSKFGLEAKAPETVPMRVLGLRVVSKNDSLYWNRDNEIPKVPGTMSQRELHSICGILLGHYPVCGWLRVTLSWLKREAGMNNWKSNVKESVVVTLKEVVKKVEEDDPAREWWCVDISKPVVVWCDASDQAIGALLQVNNEIIEDACSLRKKDDYHHINLAELNAVVKGVKLAVEWGFKNMLIKTDSKIVFHWLTNYLHSVSKVKTDGISEVLVKRRLGCVKDIIDEFELNVDVEHVPSERNIADSLTRVNKKLTKLCCVSMGGDIESVQKEHESHHLGVDRTYYLVKRNNPFIRKEVVERVVKNCSICKSIDPTQIRYEPGCLGVEDDWFRIAIDITHFRNKCYLSIIDCGPSRYAIWKEIKDEGSVTIQKELYSVFCQYGPPTEVLTDNGASFRSKEISELCSKWGVKLLFRCAYRPEGNGIVERLHRTIKRMAARTCDDPLKMLYFYNITPKEKGKENTVPFIRFFNHRVRYIEDVIPETKKKNSQYQIGGKVYVRPMDGKCYKRWSRGTVTNINSDVNVEVDGVPRHVSHLRPEPEHQSESYEGSEDFLGNEEPMPVRTRNPPAYLSDYTWGNELENINE